MKDNAGIKSYVRLKFKEESKLSARLTTFIKEMIFSLRAATSGNVDTIYVLCGSNPRIFARPQKNFVLFKQPSFRNAREYTLRATARGSKTGNEVSANFFNTHVRRPSCSPPQ